MNAIEEQFARKVCMVMHQSVREMPAETTSRLASSRRIALTHRRLTLEYPGEALSFVERIQGNLFYKPERLQRLGLSLLFAIFAFCFTAIYHDVQATRISEFAEIDSGLLSDILPLNAYTDLGFKSFLEKEMAN
jgi:hypothetical protein